MNEIELAQTLVPCTGDAQAVSPAVKRYMRSFRAEGTLSGYALDWARFARWCRTGRATDKDPVPAVWGVRRSMPATAATIAEYIAHRADQGRAMRTIQRELSAIRFRHEHYRDFTGAPLDKLPTSHPDLKQTRDGMVRELGLAARKAPAILIDDLRAMVDVQDLATARGCRDSALLLVGWWGAMRRSEILSRHVEHVEYPGEREMVIALEKQKNDQKGEGSRKIYRPPEDRRLCARSALERWLRRSEIKSGPIFRPVYNGDHVGQNEISGRCADRIVKRAAKLAGLETVGFSSHSLRAGFITVAARAGKPLHVIKAQTGHKSIQALSGYIRQATEINDECATAGLA